MAFLRLWYVIIYIKAVIWMPVNNTPGSYFTPKSNEKAIYKDLWHCFHYDLTFFHQNVLMYSHV